MVSTLSEKFCLGNSGLFLKSRSGARSRIRFSTEEREPPQQYLRVMEPGMRCVEFRPGSLPMLACLHWRERDNCRICAAVFHASWIEAEANGNGTSAAVR